MGKAQQGQLAVSVETADVDTPEDAYHRWRNFPEAGRCPHCAARIVSIVTSERSTLGQALAFLLILYFGLPGLMWLPLLTPVLNDVVHSCPRCLNVIVRKNAMACPGRGQVHTVRIGSCAMVIKQSYIFIAMGLLSVLGAVFAIVSNGWFRPFNLADVPPGRPSAVTWEKFLQDTGPRAYTRDMGRAFLLYNRYDGHLVSWEGRVRRIQEHVSPWSREHSAIVTDMFPNEVYAYTVLLFNKSMEEQVAHLLPGDFIKFNATLYEWGRRGMPTALVLRGVQEVDSLTLGGEHKNATQRLHEITQALEAADAQHLDEEEREAVLEARLEELLALIHAHPREFPEFTSPQVLQSRFPALADRLKDHDVFEGES